MLQFFGNILEPLSYAVYLLAVFLHYRKTKAPDSKMLCVFYGITTLWMLVACLHVIFKFFQKGNIWMYNAAALFTLVFIGIYFYRLLESPKKKLTVLILVAIYSIYALVKNVFLKEFALFDSAGYSMMSAFVTVMVFMYFHQVLRFVNEVDILRQFNFWLASGYLIYFVGSFIIFVSYYYLTKQILSTYTMEERSLMTALWGVHNVLLFISAFSLLIGSLWLTYRGKSA